MLIGFKSLLFIHEFIYLFRNVFTQVFERVILKSNRRYNETLGFLDLR